jgi:hypothetical protein
MPETCFGEGVSKQKTKPLGLVFIFKTFGRDSPQGNSRHPDTVFN